MTLDIAIGKRRWAKAWANRKMEWSDLVRRLTTTHKTTETHAEFMALPKTEQDDIKDVGGFVGGYLTEGRRLAPNVKHRQLITLDIDYAKSDFWEDFTMMYDCAAVVYSTHKHSPDYPRLRLVVPVDRPVTPEEYQAIARRLGGVLDIELFDPTTFQAERLMYWPSTSKDGVYEFHEQQGEPLQADKVLATYVDWKDTSAWPVSERAKKIIKRDIAKAGNPLEKRGIIGAFCRTYGITAAIEAFLSDVYEPVEGFDGRFTFLAGTSAAGLVVYKDIFAYSHHSTDPAADGHPQNAFDLVRLHKFGLKDEGSKEEGVRLPSFVAMSEFAANDRETKITLGKETDNEYAEMKEQAAAETEWHALLERDNRGKCLNTIGNVTVILDNDPELAGCFKFDDFMMRKVIVKDLPWRKKTNDTRFLTDEDEQNVTKFLERKYKIRDRANNKDALATHFAQNRFHPVRDFLNELVWDGVRRLDTLFIDYLGAEDNAYVRAVTRKTFVAAVARVFRPGVKFDYVPVLTGAEGIGKSTILDKMGGAWFSDSFNFGMLKNNQAYEQLQGAWIIELGELAGLRKAEVEAVKHFISKREDIFRYAYGHNTVNFKRQGIFIATTNTRGFLYDPEGGGRRFWPIDTDAERRTKNMWETLNLGEVKQVWAEALLRYREKEALHLSEELEGLARLEQYEHKEVDSRLGMLEKYLDRLLPENWDALPLDERRRYIHEPDPLESVGVNLRTRVCAMEIWCELFRNEEANVNRQNTKDIHAMMRHIGGWEEYRSRTIFKHFGNQKGYFRKKG